MSKSVTYYIHIGMPKTGTTSLQKFFQRNYQSLIQKGCLYPITGRGEAYNHSLLRFSAGGYNFWSIIFKLLGFKEPNWLSKHIPISELKRSLSEEVTKTQTGKVVLSSELLSIVMTKRAIKNLSKLIGGDAIIKPVIYIRKQEQIAQSLYSELIKNRTYRSSYKFRPTVWAWVPFLNYYKEYAKWADVFGWENVIIRSYEQLYQGDVIQDFLITLDMDMEGLHIPETKANPHLNTDAINALREANRKGVPDDEFMNLKDKMFQNTKQNKRFNFMDPEKYLIFNKRFESSNKKLAREYFGREDLFL